MTDKCRDKSIKKYWNWDILAWYNNNNNIRLVTLAEHTSDHGKQTVQTTAWYDDDDRPKPRT